MKRIFYLIIFPFACLSLFAQENQPKEIIRKTFKDSILVDSTTTKFSYDINANKTRREAFKNNQKISETFFEYNESNNISEEIIYIVDMEKITAGTNQTDNTETYYYYDENGREIETVTCHIPRINNPNDSCYLKNQKITEYINGQISRVTNNFEFVGLYTTSVYHYIHKQLEIIESFQWDAVLVDKSEFNQKNAFKSIRTVLKDEQLRPIKEISCSVSHPTMSCTETVYKYDTLKTEVITKSSHRESRIIKSFDENENLILEELYEQKTMTDLDIKNQANLKYRKSYFYKNNRLREEIHESWRNKSVLGIDNYQYTKIIEKYFY